MTVNVAGLRFVADAIEANQLAYAQWAWGASVRNSEVAGTGVSCGTPACVAGFAVQFLGHPEVCKAKFEIGGDSISTIMMSYAGHLLGLPKEWARAIFRHGEWPLHWVYEPEHEFWDSCSDRTKRISPSTKLRIGSYFSGIVRTPDPYQAATFLRRLADQFEAEQGVNVNEHNPVHVEVYE